MYKTFRPSIYILLFLGFLNSFVSHAQQARNENYWLVFEQDSVYLGRLGREEAPIRHSFEFTTGKQPIKIKDVKSDCACITITFPKDSLNPGEKGKIEVEFRPYRAGPFDKEFIIFFDKVEDEVGLKMTGYLEAFYPSPSLEYKVENGPLKFRFQKVHFGNVEKGKVVKKEVDIYNDQNQFVEFADSVNTPPHIELVFPEDRRIRAKSSGKVIVYYDPGQKEDFGYLTDQITFFINGNKLQPIEMEVVALVLPERAQPDKYGELPQLKASSDSIDLGTLYELDQVVSLQLMNTGRASLTIQKVETQPGCEILSLEAKEVKPLSSVNLNLRITDNGLTGTQQRIISIYSNDPKRPYYPVHVFFQLKQKKR